MFFIRKNLILTTFTILACYLFFAWFFRIYSLENIPVEKSEDKIKIQKGVTLSKLNTDEAINYLESLNNLPKYTNYKKDYLLAKLYEKKDNLNKAILIYEKLQDMNYPLKERVLFHFANLNAKQGNDLTAVRLFNKLLKEFPYSRSVPQTKYHLAQALIRLRLTNQGINTFKSLKNEFKETQFGIAANYYLAEFEYNKKNFGEAVQFFRAYLKESPDGRFRDEIADLFNKLKNEHNIILLSEDYSLLGDVFFLKKDYINATRYYKTSNQAEKYYNLGYSLYRIKENKEAFKYLKDFVYRFPKSENIRWALYYCNLCIPNYERYSFWENITKDFPELAYYTLYRLSELETNTLKKEKILKDLISKYPNTDFTLDAVWEIMWQKLKEKKYEESCETGNKYFYSNKNSKSETRAKIGFFLGKIAEINKDKTKAVKYYKDTENIAFDNYYSFRAKHRLQELEGNSDPLWRQENTDYNNLNVGIPGIINKTSLKKHYGAAVHELIDLKLYDEAIELIGKSKSPSLKITTWLQALNNEYENSINNSSKLIIQNKIKKDNSLWKLAYPTYFFEYIEDYCKNYFQNIDPFLVLGLIRQESRFEKNAVSVSNAKGLMQLIPPTAVSTARQVGINLISQDMLYDPKINIHLGIKYLQGLIQDSSNPLFAVASYNAGPKAVERWIRSFHGNDLDFFIEEIPYEQTRTYVKKVFAGYWTYLELYKNQE